MEAGLECCECSPVVVTEYNDLLAKDPTRIDGPDHVVVTYPRPCKCPFKRSQAGNTVLRRACARTSTILRPCDDTCFDPSLCASG
jgi:hypothetical protein